MSFSLNVGTNATATGGDLEFYVYNANYVGLGDFVAQGDSSTVLSLPPGDYLIAVVVRTIFTPTGSSPTPAFVYSMPGFVQGSLL